MTLTPPTRPGSLSQAEIDKLLEGLVNRGARVEMKDPRLTSIQTWLWGVLGTAFVSGLWFGVSSFNELSKNVALLIQRGSYSDKTDEKQERHMESIDRKNELQDDRIRALENFHAKQGMQP